MTGLVATTEPPAAPVVVVDVPKDITVSYPPQVNNSSSNVAHTVQISPQRLYNGGYPEACEIRLRIANGGAGQIGLIDLWANAFVRFAVQSLQETPFLVAWYLRDTTESLSLLASGKVDVAVTYNAAAEAQLMLRGAATRRTCVFRDHFLVVGPPSNPANLDPKDDVFAMFNKIVLQGNIDSDFPPDEAIRPPVRFLSRFDKSATNIKESELFARIGQVPWALPYSKWYHQYPRFPLQAISAAAHLSEYTLIDYGAWLVAPSSVRTALRVYKLGSDAEDDPLINPAHALLSKEASSMGVMFMDWVKGENGQRIVEEFHAAGQRVYTKAPAPRI